MSHKRTDKMPHFQVGAKNTSDPDWMEATTDASTILEWIAAIEPVLLARVPTTQQLRARTKTARVLNSEPLFTAWQCTALRSFAVQARKHAAEGRTKLLTGRQIVVLRMMVDRAATATATILESQ